MSRAQVEEVVRLAEKYQLVVMADEVYQENIWAPGKSFVSFRKVVLELGAKVQLFSFHSISKGYYGECGLRGGVLELTNIDPEVNDQIYKLFSMTLCANTLGQAMMASVLNPPTAGEPSYALFEQEKGKVLKDLEKKAQIVHEGLNSVK